MEQRQTLARRDTAERREKITSARKLIYEKGYVVDTAQVEAKLKDESLIPTVVNLILKLVLKVILTMFRMRFQTGWATQVLISFSFWL